MPPAQEKRIGGGPVGNAGTVAAAPGRAVAGRAALRFPRARARGMQKPAARRPCVVWWAAAAAATRTAQKRPDLIEKARGEGGGERRQSTGGGSPDQAGETPVHESNGACMAPPKRNFFQKKTNACMEY